MCASEALLQQHCCCCCNCHTTEEVKVAATISAIVLGWGQASPFDYSGAALLPHLVRLLFTFSMNEQSSNCDCDSLQVTGPHLLLASCFVLLC